MTIRVITNAELEAEKKLIAALKPEPAPATKAALVDEKTENVPGTPAETLRDKSESNKKDTLLNILVKYIPITVIAGYTFLDSIFRSVAPVPEALWMACFILLLIGAGILTYLITVGPAVDIAAMVAGKEDLAKMVNDWQTIIMNQRIKQSVIAMIAFSGYVMCIGGPFTSVSQLLPGFDWQAYFGSVALVMATLFIAIIAAKDLLAS